MLWSYDEVHNQTTLKAAFPASQSRECLKAKAQCWRACGEACIPDIAGGNASPFSCKLFCTKSSEYYKKGGKPNIPQWGVLHKYDRLLGWNEFCAVKKCQVCVLLQHMTKFIVTSKKAELEIILTLWLCENNKDWNPEECK